MVMNVTTGPLEEDEQKMEDRAPPSFTPPSNARPRSAKVPFGRLFYVESGTPALDCMVKKKKNHSALIKTPPNNSHTLAQAAVLPRGSGASDCFVLDLYDAPLTSIALASVDAGRAGTGERGGSPVDMRSGTTQRTGRGRHKREETLGREVGLLGKAWWD